MRVLSALILVLAAAHTGWADAPSLDPYAALQEHAGDETAYVAQLRAIDRIERALIETALQEATQLRRDGQGEAAQARANEAIARADRLRGAYETALARFSGNAVLHNHLGEIQFDYYNEQPAALKAWNLAITLDASLPDPHNNLALYHFHHGQYGDGLRHMDEALRLDPKNADFLFNLVQIYLVHGPQVRDLRGWPDQARVYKEAMKMSERAAKLRPDDYSLLKDHAVNFWKAEQMQAKPDWRGAARASARARAKAPNPTEVFFMHLQEGRAWLKANRPKSARPALEAALKLRPDSEPTKALLEKANASGRGR